MDNQSFIFKMWLGRIIMLMIIRNDPENQTNENPEIRYLDSFKIIKQEVSSNDIPRGSV